MISVVIPARNEAAGLPRLLERLQTMPEIGETWVADGGSSDATIAVAEALGACVVEGARGRGAQQNAAAAQCRGEVLWFLHADALPAKNCGRQIERAVKSGAIGGNFRLHFQANGFWPRCFERIARFQRKRGTYYGDSGLWVTREAWEKIGGFEPWPLFEDLDFARKMEALAPSCGQTTLCCPGRLHASARRFEKEPWRILWLWARLQWAFERGASPDELAQIYHG
jgi:rSAM/selenodomain-associated transferase 2